ncbi:hypothetical protein ACFL2C_04310 [Patescibacteria group bacterium]
MPDIQPEYKPSLKIAPEMRYISPRVCLRDLDPEAPCEARIFMRIGIYVLDNSQL